MRETEREDSLTEMNAHSRVSAHGLKEVPVLDSLIPDELLKFADHPFGLGRHVARLCGTHNCAGATFVFSQAETDGLVFAVRARGNEEFTLVSVLCLPEGTDFSPIHTEDINSSEFL